MIDVRSEFQKQNAEVVHAEVQALRDTLRTTTQRLNYCEDMLRFYADPRNYQVGAKIDGHDFQDRVKLDYEDAHNTSRVKIAGARARLYFRTYDHSFFE